MATTPITNATSALPAAIATPPKPPHHHGKPKGAEGGKPASGAGAAPASAQATTAGPAGLAVSLLGSGSNKSA